MEYVRVVLPPDGTRDGLHSCALWAGLAHQAHRRPVCRQGPQDGPTWHSPALMAECSLREAMLDTRTSAACRLLDHSTSPPWRIYAKYSVIRPAGRSGGLSGTPGHSSSVVDQAGSSVFAARSGQDGSRRRLDPRRSTSSRPHPGAAWSHERLDMGKTEYRLLAQAPAPTPAKMAPTPIACSCTISSAGPHGRVWTRGRNAQNVALASSQVIRAATQWRTCAMSFPMSHHRRHPHDRGARAYPFVEMLAERIAELLLTPCPRRVVTVRWRSSKSAPARSASRSRAKRPAAAAAVRHLFTVTETGDEPKAGRLTRRRSLPVDAGKSRPLYLASADRANGRQDDADILVRQQADASRPDHWFTGTVWQDPIVEAPAPARIRAGRVSSSRAPAPPGTRPARTRPCSVSGVGRAADLGGPVRENPRGRQRVDFRLTKNLARGGARHMEWFTSRCRKASTATTCGGSACVG